MKTIKTNGKTVLAIPISPNATEISISYQNGLWFRNGKVWDDSAPVRLPPGNWRILGLSNELNEEQMKEIIPNHAHLLAPDIWEAYASFLSANKLVYENGISGQEAQEHVARYLILLEEVL